MRTLAQVPAALVGGLSLMAACSACLGYFLLATLLTLRWLDTLFYMRATFKFIF
jgi:hypothetical protein